MTQRKVCVYCGSSRTCDPDYLQAAHRVGECLADARLLTAYGGGAVGSMGALADGVLSRGGHIIGVIPQFMVDLEWARSGLTRLEIVEDMRIRKHLMLEGSAAAIALPGGTGTFEELLEALTLKRLKIYTGSIVIMNYRGYFDSLLRMFDIATAERFMDESQSHLWKVVTTPEEVVQSIVG